MCSVVLLTISLLCAFQTQGSAAVTHLVAKMGDDVHLKCVTSVVLVKNSEFRWKFNNSRNIARMFYDNTTTITNLYLNRAEIYPQNRSLLLKNVHMADSGLYTATIIGDEDRSVVAYILTVQEPVSSVKMTVAPASTSLDVCNLTVSCSTKDSHLVNSTFQCDNHSCNLLEGTPSKVTSPGATLQVVSVNGSISCRHSNSISSTEDTKEFHQFCSQTVQPVPSQGTAIGLGVTAAVVAFLIALSIGLFIKCRRKRHRYSTDPQDNNNLGRTQNQNPGKVATGLSPTSTYALVNFHSRPVESTNTITADPPETVYAHVSKAINTKPQIPGKQHPEVNREEPPIPPV